MMLWLVLSLALAATRVRAEKFPAVMDGTRWRTNGTTSTNPVRGCDVEYTQALILTEGAEATLSFSGMSKFTVNGMTLPNGGDLSISLDGGPQLIYDTKSEQNGCMNYGAINVADPTGAHQIRVFVPVQDGEVVFALLGADLGRLEDETLITDTSPPPTVPNPSQSSTTPPTTTNSNSASTPSTTGSQSTTPGPTNTSPPPVSTGLSTGSIVGIGVAIPVVLALIGVFSFVFIRRRRDAQKAAEATTGAPTPYRLEAGGGLGRPPHGGGGGSSSGQATRSPATTADTKLRGMYLSSRADEKEPRAYYLGDASSGEDPFPSTGSSSAKRAVYMRRGDAPNQLPPGAAAPSTPSMSMSGPATSSGSPISNSVSPQLSTGSVQPQPEPEMRELYQAMHQAGFTVNTLFDRLRRDESTRRRARGGTDVGTAVPQSAVGEPLPRYE